MEDLSAPVGREPEVRPADATHPRLLLVILLAAFALRFGAALLSPNMFWPDEIFQTLEPAHRLAYGYGMVTWEFRVGARSWVLPAVLAGVMRLTDWLGPGSGGYLAGIAFFLSLLATVPVYVAWLWGSRVGGTRAGVVAALVCATWPDLVYFSPKALTEVIAAHLLLPGLYLAVGSEEKSRRTLFLAGLLCGLAAAIRILLAPAVLLAMAWACRREFRARWLPMGTGVLLPLLFFGLVDATTWGYPFYSYWMFYWQNLVVGKSPQSGLVPWYGYWKMMGLIWGWARLPFLGLAALGVRRSGFLGCMALLIVFQHSLIPHKEYRYIFPAVLLLCVLAGFGLSLLRDFFRRRWQRLSVLTTSVLLAFWLLLAGYFAYRHGPFFQQLSGYLRAMSQVSRSSDACGVGWWNVSWAVTGGYTYLHRDIPVYQAWDAKAEEVQRSSSLVNYIVTPDPPPGKIPGFEVLWCRDYACLLKREGACVALPGYHINRILEEQGF